MRFPMWLTLSSLSLALSPALPAQVHSAGIRLPKSAVIHLGPSVPREGEVNTDCSYFRLSEAAVRRRFASYRVISGQDEHDSYATLPCRIDGKLIVKGSSYDFAAIEGNMLWTNYPGPKGILLGGPSSSGDDTYRGDPDVTRLRRSKR